MTETQKSDRYVRLYANDFIKVNLIWKKIYISDRET